jgi:coproporphyrinogen III oxidase-like Fe-S oxidoreductase
MDHFAKPEDDWPLPAPGPPAAQFQGYSTHADCDMIGLGVSSIGKVGLFARTKKTWTAITPRWTKAGCR